MNIPVDIAFHDEDEDVITDLLEQGGAADVEVIHQRGFTGVETIIVGIAAVHVLSDLVAKLARTWNAGVVLDTRGHRLVTEKRSDLPRGQVVVIHGADEKVTFSAPESGDLAQWLEVLGAKP